MAAPLDPQVGHGCCGSGEGGGGAAVCAGGTGLTEAIAPAADASCAEFSCADASCHSVSGSAICVSSFWSVIGVIA